MTTNTKQTALDALFDQAEATRQAYANDETTLTPVALFVNAFRQFYDELTYRPTERYEDALRFLNPLARCVGDLEGDEDAPGVWRLWENARRSVDAYDRRQKAKTTPPALSIDELLEQGVGKKQIALIYGFLTEDGDPDISRVDARASWNPPSDATEPEADATQDEPTTTNATETNATNDDANATTNATPATEEAAESTTSAPPSVDFAAIDAELAAGVPARQLAAKYGVDVETIRTRSAKTARRAKKES